MRSASERQTESKRKYEQEILRCELSLRRSESLLIAGKSGAAWEYLMQMSQPLLQRLDTPASAGRAEVSRLRMHSLSLMGDSLLALVDEAWQQESTRRARRWLSQANLYLKNPPDYPDRERHQRLFADWRQKLKQAADPTHALQKLLARLEAAADLVRKANVSEARSLFALMRGKLQRLRQLQANLPIPLDINLADELEKELQEFVDGLEQAERQRQHEADIQRLRTMWPRLSRDAATDHAYRQATVCKSTSDSDDRPGWDALEAAFDQQNARRMLFRAIEQVRSNSARSLPIRLTDAAIRLDPTLAPLAAVLLSATAFSRLDRQFPSLRMEREQLLERGRHLTDYAQVSREADRLVRREELLRETEAFLRRLSALLIRQKGITSGDARRAARRNARELGRALTPFLRYGSVSDLRVASQIVEHWRKVAPDSFDPRHPLHRLQRRLQVQQRLFDASVLLVQATGEVGEKAATLRAKAKALVGDALHLQIDRWRALREAVRLYGVACWSDQQAATRLRRLMDLVAGEYQRAFRQNQKKSWLSSVNLVTVDRWLLSCSSVESAGQGTSSESRPK